MTLFEISSLAFGIVFNTFIGLNLHGLLDRLPDGNMAYTNTDNRLLEFGGATNDHFSFSTCTFDLHFNRLMSKPLGVNTKRFANCTFNFHTQDMNNSPNLNYQACGNQNLTVASFANCALESNTFAVQSPAPFGNGNVNYIVSHNPASSGSSDGNNIITDCTPTICRVLRSTAGCSAANIDFDCNDF